MVLDSTGEIETKARDSAGLATRSFTPDALAMLRAVDGRYSNVQSINSEDTVTWTALGNRLPARVLPTVLDDAFGPAVRPATWKRSFWQRSPHPHTKLIQNGPEPDLTLTADGGWCYVIEAKWAADIDGKQGAGGGMTQLEMRTAVARSVSSDETKRGVLVIAPEPDMYPYAGSGTFARYFRREGNGYVPLPAATALEARAVSWAHVLDVIVSAEPQSEVAQYLRWRHSHLRQRRSSG